MELFLTYDIEKSYVNAGEKLIRHWHFFQVSAASVRHQGSVRYCWSWISPALPSYGIHKDKSLPKFFQAAQLQTQQENPKNFSLIIFGTLVRKMFHCS